MDAYTIDTDGVITPVLPKNGTDFTLSELYELIGCETIQVFQANNGDFIICDEDGRLKNSKTNLKATVMHKNGSILVGKVVVCKQSMFR